MDVFLKLLFLLGESGVGKSSLAQAIAQHCGSDYKFIKLTDIHDKYKDSGSHNISEAFKTVKNIKFPYIFILDEMQCLVKSRNYKDVDQSAAETLWAAMDECASNENILIIGTANKIKHLPQQLLSRISSSVFTIDCPSMQARKEILKYYLLRIPGNIVKKFDESEIKYLAQKTMHFSMQTTSTSG